MKFDILPRSKVLQLEIQGTQKGLLLLRKISEKKEPLSIAQIKRVHKVCFGDILQDRADTVRKVDREGEIQNII